MYEVVVGRQRKKDSCGTVRLGVKYRQLKVLRIYRPYVKIFLQARPGPGPFRFSVIIQPNKDHTAITEISGSISSRIIFSIAISVPVSELGQVPQAPSYRILNVLSSRPTTSSQPPSPAK